MLQLDFNASSGLSQENSVAIDLQTISLELEELVAMVESGLDEEGQPLSEAQISAHEARILVLDQKLRTSAPSKSTFKKDR